MKPRILFNITHGFQARMLLRTEIAESLIRSGAELIVVSPNADEAYFREEFAKEGFVLESTPQRYGRLEKAVVTTRAYLLMNPELGNTLNYKRERYRRAYPLRYWVTRAGNAVLGRTPSLRRSYLRAEAALFSGREYDSLLRTWRPDLVVSGTPGFNVYDAHVLRAARRTGIPTATVTLSWDNLTSKGYMGAQPDSLLVWNDVMKDEARRYHDFRGPIIEVGAAHFDVYPRILSTIDRSAFRRDQGIPQDASLVVWGTINSDIYPNQLDLLRQFADAYFSSNTAGRQRFLWVRVHPQSVSGAHQHLVEECLALERHNVRIELPPVISERLRWDLPRGDMEHLAGLMATADVVVTPQSTLTIDAACAGTPVVNLGIDRNFSSTFSYTHYKNILKFGGVTVVRSFEGLCQVVDEYLDDPGLHEEGRRAIVNQQMGTWFGRAGQRTADTLLSLASV